jgi:hypothetical protein
MLRVPKGGHGRRANGDDGEKDTQRANTTSASPHAVHRDISFVQISQRLDGESYVNGAEHDEQSSDNDPPCVDPSRVHAPRVRQAVTKTDR